MLGLFTVLWNWPGACKSGRIESMRCRMDAVGFIFCETAMLHILEGKGDVSFSSSLQLIESGGQITILVNIVKPRGNNPPREQWATWQ